jgi:serine/threonine protein kinase
LSEDFSTYLGRFQPGSVLSSYTLEALVAEGGMAWVFRARHLRLDRLVALKVLKPALASDLGYQRRFVAEARAASAVDDPHIIPVYEADEADGVLFIAMRFIPGGDLSRLAAIEGPMPSARATDFISPVASALDAAHGAGLVHRDVKPANILVDARTGRPDHVYLSDFGVSKAAMSTVNLTGIGDFIGTASYSAPEQFEGKAVDGRTDQYALACVTYQLLTGTVPFKRDTFISVMMAHVNAPPPSLVAQRPDLPVSADRVLAKALAKAAQDRYETCGDFAEALREALGLTPYNARNSATASPSPGFLATSPPASHPQTAVVNEPTPPVPPSAGPVPALANPQNTMTVSASPAVTEIPAEALTDERDLTRREADDEPSPAEPSPAEPSPARASDTVASPQPQSDDAEHPEVEHPEVEHPEVEHPATVVGHPGAVAEIPAPAATAIETAPAPADPVADPTMAAIPVEPTDVAEIPAETLLAESPDATAELPADTVIAEPPEAAAELAADTIIAEPPDATAELPADTVIAEPPDVTTQTPADTVIAAPSDLTAEIPAADLITEVPETAPSEPGAQGTTTDPAPDVQGTATDPSPAVDTPLQTDYPAAVDQPELPATGSDGAPATHVAVGPPFDGAKPPGGAVDWIRRHRIPSVALGCVIAAAAGLIPFTLISNARTPNPTKPTTAASASSQPTPTRKATTPRYSGVVIDLPAANAGGPLSSLTFGPSGTTLALADGAGICLWNIATHRCTATFPVARSVVFSPDGSTLAAVGGSDADRDTVRLWDVTSGKKTATLTDPHSQGTYAAAYNPDGSTLAVGDGNGNTYLWDASFNRVTTAINGLSHSTFDAVTFSPDGTTLAIGDAAGSADLVNTGTKEVIFPVTVKHPTPPGINSLAFSPDGKTLAIGDANGYAYLVNIASRKVIAELTDPGSKGVASVAFSPGGSTLAVGDANGSTYVVNVASKAAIATLADPGSKGVASVAFSPDGKKLATGDTNGSAYLWYGSFG